MSASSLSAVHGLLNSKLLLSVAAALMLTACSDAMDRFASNPSDADPVYTASVPKQKAVREEAGGDGEEVIVSRPLANASVKQPKYNYSTSYKAPAYKQPALTKSASLVPQVPADDIDAPSAPAGGKVTVGAGMTLYSIARANNVSVAQLAAANNLRAPYAVHKGQVLRIPGHAQASLPPATSKRTAAVSKPKAAGGMHEVASGETLFALGRKYGVSPYAIADANGLPHDAQLHLGQKVKIPGGTGSMTAQKAPAPQAAAPKIASTAIDETAAPEEPAAAQQTAQVQQQPQTEASPSAAAETTPAQPAEVASTAMRWPVRGKVISNFGAKPNGLKNEGINISVPEGTSIRAAEGGVVAYAGNELKGYGNLVLIRHEGGYVTAYAHAKELFVKRGDTVKRGDVIAKAGQTGSVSSPQLHFEVRKGATALDPMKFLSASTAMN